MKIILLLTALVLLACNRKDRPANTHDTIFSANQRDAAIQSNPAEQIDTSRTTDDESNWKTYRNERYRFEFKYPPGLHPTARFSTQDILPGSWRAMAGEKDRGTPVVEIPIVHFGDRTAYPRFYDVSFRIGVSDPGVSCSAGNGERSIGSIAINGVNFEQYEFSDAATMKYVSGISYRTERDGRCFAIEQLRAGSNYRDTTSKADIPQAELDRYYYLAGKIVKTVRFW
jgi:hypothetical protein